MRRFLKYIGLIFTCTVLLALVNDWACRWFISQSTGNPIYKMDRLWQSGDENEIAIVGSSRAQSNYVPSLISTNCFNYGCDGQGYAETLFHLTALKARGGDAPIIINYDPWWVTISKDVDYVGDYRMAPNSGRVSCVDTIPGIRLYGYLRKSATDWLNAKAAVTKVIDNGAVLLKNSRSDSEWEVINEKQKPYSFRRDEESCAIFKETLNGFAPRKVCVVVAPCSKRFIELFEGRVEFDQFMKELEDIPNVCVENMFGDDRFVGADFVDTTHLNMGGASKFTQAMMKQIQYVFSSNGGIIGDQFQCDDTYEL